MKLKDFSVTVRKLTDEELMREACEMTFLGKSHQSLKSMYRSEHSPVRTQIFWIKLENIPLFVATHLIRHHVGSQPFQLTCREDRPGGNPGLIKKVEALLMGIREIREKISCGVIEGVLEKLDWMEDELRWIMENTDRYTPVNLGLLVNAQSLIDMAKLRECKQASAETRVVFTTIRRVIEEVDPDLAMFMVPKCVYCGGICHEPKCCGYNTTDMFCDELKEYLSKAIGHKNCQVLLQSRFFQENQESRPMPNAIP